MKSAENQLHQFRRSERWNSRLKPTLENLEEMHGELADAVAKLLFTSNARLWSRKRGQSLLWYSEHGDDRMAQTNWKHRGDIRIDTVNEQSDKHCIVKEAIGDRARNLNETEGISRSLSFIPSNNLLIVIMTNLALLSYAETRWNGMEGTDRLIGVMA